MTLKKRHLTLFAGLVFFITELHPLFYFNSHSTFGGWMHTTQKKDRGVGFELETLGSISPGTLYVLQLPEDIFLLFIFRLMFYPLLTKQKMVVILLYYNVFLSLTQIDF